jgi:acetylornithine deacetylase
MDGWSAIERQQPRFIFAFPSFLARFQGNSNFMNVFTLTRALVDLDSTTGREAPVADYLFARLRELATARNGKIERMLAAQGRDNILVTFGEPIVTLSTHMDTVPPFFPSREDDSHIFGRGACDAKGIVAAMISAAENLLEENVRSFALLFVVGEERDSAGARAAAVAPLGSQFLINGEPTENLLALGSQGALRYELNSRGKAAHSAYPELGHSAIHALLEVLHDIRNIKLPHDATLGSSTLNVGTISGGRAPNVIADQAQAEIMFRTVGDPSFIRREVQRISANRVEAREVHYSAAVHLQALEGFPTTVVAFTTDIPIFDGTWGRPLLIGPGSIHVAHTSEECIAKKDLDDAVNIYARMVRQLVTSGVPS